MEQLTEREKFNLELKKKMCLSSDEKEIQEAWEQLQEPTNEDFSYIVAYCKNTEFKKKAWNVLQENCTLEDFRFIMYCTENNDWRKAATRQFLLLNPSLGDPDLGMCKEDELYETLVVKRLEKRLEELKNKIQRE